MSLPLPLELTKAVPMTADLDTLLAASYSTVKYDPKTQLFGGGGCGSHHGGNNTNSQCVNCGLLQIDDVLQDFTIRL